MIISTHCKRCGVTIRLDFGDLTRQAAVEMAHKMDVTPRECPGYHTELGGFWDLWDLGGAIHRAYDLGEAEEPVPIPSDAEYVGALLGEARDIWDGGQNLVPELGLRSIHEEAGLTHLGFGSFATEIHEFQRCDSPRGTRYYERVMRR